MVSPIEVFLCYAHEDEMLCNELVIHLRVLKRQGFFNLWYDREISAGTEWEREIEEHLNTAQVILLLVSPHFMDSDYCYGIEMIRAIDRHERGEARVIPIILHPVFFQRAPFAKLKSLPRNGKAISSWQNLYEAFFDVAEGIRKAIEEISAKSSTATLLASVPEQQQPQFPAAQPNLLQSTQSSLVISSLKSTTQKGQYYVPGEKVHHSTFGEGVVVDSDLEMGIEYVSVQFKDGRKRLSMAFTNLEKL